MEAIALRRSSTQAKIIGTVVSISGALVVVLYRGPKISSSQSLTPLATISLQWPLELPNSDWLVGGLLLSTEYILYSIWNIFQAQILQMFPMELVVTFFYTLFVTIISAPVCLVAERDIEAWLLRPDTNMALAAIIYAGFFGSFFSTLIHSWGIRLKGPVYVASFRPISIAIAAIMGSMFLGDQLHLGSVIGAVIISLGFYAVIWGKKNEERAKDDAAASDRLDSGRVPLLQNSPRHV